MKRGVCIKKHTYCWVVDTSILLSHFFFVLLVFLHYPSLRMVYFKKAEWRGRTNRERKHRKSKKPIKGPKDFYFFAIINVLFSARHGFSMTIALSFSLTNDNLKEWIKPEYSWKEYLLLGGQVQNLQKTKQGQVGNRTFKWNTNFFIKFYHSLD